jgi:hypothetical protein
MANDCASLRGTSIAKLKPFLYAAVEVFIWHSMPLLAVFSEGWGREAVVCEIVQATLKWHSVRVIRRLVAEYSAFFSSWKC